MKEASYKATKGLIRVRLDIEDRTIKTLQISGDFFMYPDDTLWDLESFLLGKKLDRDSLVTEISDFYTRFSVSSPGVTPEDFVNVILLASES